MKCDLVWKDCPLHRKMYLVKESPFDVNNVGDDYYGDGNCKDQDIYLVPSILDRLKCLRRSISNRHPLYDGIHELVVDLESNCCEEETCDGDGTRNFGFVYAIFKGILKPHKLHSLLLQRTIYDNMIHKETNNKSRSTSIHRFMGDILIVYFLMGHVASGIVEGVNESNWISQLSKTDIEGNDMDTTTYLWYQRFICYYSTLLRTLPLTSDQMIRMGLANEEIIRQKLCRFKPSQGGSFLIPQSPYCKGANKTAILEKILSHEDSVSISCTLYDFGPLGPAFRGRDNVRFTHLTAARPGIEVIEALDQIPFSQYNCSHDVSDVLASLRSNQFDPLSELINLHRESKKTIPINVKSGSIEVHVK